MSHTRAQIIADTVSHHGQRITTFQVYAPRYLLAEINTHRVISKSAASSRAIPINTRIDMVEREPYIPDVFGKNRPGMQATDFLEDTENAAALTVWESAKSQMVACAKLMAELGVHKQQANRLLEPFVYYHGVMTATEWDNFWFLRDSADADPGFAELARLMRKAYNESVPRVHKYHLPYTDDCDPSWGIAALKSISSARCARVSYQTFDGKTSTPESDRKLCEDLLAKGHLSPFDHAATADITYRAEDGRVRWLRPGLHRQNYGWIPYRVEVEHEKGWTCRRDSYEPLPEGFKQVYPETV